MREEIFINALAATARIACCAGLVGVIACGEKATDTAQSTDTATADTTDTAETTQPLAPEEVNFDNCLTAINDAFVDETVDHSPLLECCLLTTEQLGYEELYDPSNAHVQENCCDLIAEQGEFSSACTPWGPPTPPAMPKKEVFHA